MGLAEEHGARWRLLLLQADREELLRRLVRRDAGDGFGPMGAGLLDAIAAASEEARGEGEEVVVAGGLPPGRSG